MFYGESSSVQIRSNEHVETFPLPTEEISPRKKAFLDDLAQRRSKIVQVTYDRVAQNAKELTVARGEYLEVCLENASLIQGRAGYCSEKSQKSQCSSSQF